MLIGIDASRAVAARPTGTEVYSQRLLSALLELGSSHRFRFYLREAPPTDAFPLAELRVIPLPRLWSHLRLSWELLRHRPDVLFVPAHVLPLAHPAPSVVTIHDLGYLHFPETHPWQQRLYLDASTRWSARHAHHLLADSQATKADLVSYYHVAADRVTVAYPGVDPALAPVRRPEQIAAAKARYGITGDYLLYLGTLQPRKNLQRLIEAYAALLETQGEGAPNLVLAGRLGWLYDELFTRAARLGLAGRVHFCGYVAEEHKAALLSGARAFVFPSLYEGFGLPVLEAQACGCPVLTSDTSSLPEAAGEGALLVAPGDMAAIAAGLARLVADGDLRRSLAARGLENVRRFSWGACARTVLATLEHAAGLGGDLDGEPSAAVERYHKRRARR